MSQNNEIKALLELRRKNDLRSDLCDRLKCNSWVVTATANRVLEFLNKLNIPLPELGLSQKEEQRLLLHAGEFEAALREFTSCEDEEFLRL